MSARMFGDAAAEIVANGYAVLPVYRGQKNPIPSGWQTYEFQPSDLPEYAAAGIGILSTRTPAVDNDVRDPAVAAEIDALIEAELGPAPKRIGAAPKSLRVYRLDGEPFAKVQTREYRLPGDKPGDKPHRVEILADGQQFVAYNIHKDTKRPYEWNGSGEPLTMPVSQLPTLSKAQAEAFRDKAEAILAARGTPLGRLETAGNERPHASNEKIEADDPQKLREALGFIKNEDLSYGDWVYVGLAIKGALGEDGADDFIEWSAQSAKDEPRETERAWNSFKPERIGAGTIYYLARRAGWRVPNDAIQVRGGSLTENTDDTLAVLSRRGVVVGIFVRGTDLVRPHTVERRGVDGEMVKALELATLEASTLKYHLGGMIGFWRKRKDGREVQLNCPGELAAAVIGVCGECAALPRLDAISSSPVYLGSGRLLATTGYHAERRLWLTVPAGVRCDERPGRAQAEAALVRLRGWIREFPFAGALSESVMLAAMMTGVLRPSLPHAPGFAFDAPEYGSGKSTAGKLVHVVAFGRPPAVMQFQRNDEELRKSIDAAQIAGYQALFFDNVPKGVVVSSDSLAQVLTEPERRPRRLGESELRDVPCTQLVLITGNNLSIGEDLTRRVLACRLDPQTDPTARVFQRPDLLGDARRERAAILSDVFTVAAAYEAAGAVDLKAQPLVGYEAWSRWVQRPLVWLGCADPVESVRALQADDPERETLEEVVALWHRVHGTQWISVGQLVTYHQLHPEHGAMTELQALLRGEAGIDQHGQVNRRKLGRWLAGMRGRWTSEGLRIEQEGSTKSKRSAGWRVAARSEGLEGFGGFYRTPGSTNTDESVVEGSRKNPRIPSKPSEVDDGL